VKDPEIGYQIGLGATAPRAQIGGRRPDRLQDQDVAGLGDVEQQQDFAGNVLAPSATSLPQEGSAERLHGPVLILTIGHFRVEWL
jgi:hypothetical protein